MKFKKIKVLLFICVIVTIIAFLFINTRNKGYQADGKNVSKESCNLCGVYNNNPFKDLWGEDNLVLVNLNTFDFVLLLPDKENSKTSPKSNDFEAVIMDAPQGSSTFFGMANLSRRYTLGTIELGKSSKLSQANLKQFICIDCFNGVMNNYLLENAKKYDVGIISLKTKKLRPLYSEILGFAVDDFYVSCEALDGKIGLNIFYCPKH